MESPFLLGQGGLLLGTNKLGLRLGCKAQSPAWLDLVSRAKHPISLRGKTFCQAPSAPENPIGNSGWSVLDSVEAVLDLGTCHPNESALGPGVFK